MTDLARTSLSDIKKGLLNGTPLIVYDFDGREEEADMVFYAGSVTWKSVNQLRLPYPAKSDHTFASLFEELGSPHRHVLNSWNCVPANFSIVIGSTVYKFRTAAYIFIFFIVSLIVFLFSMWSVSRLCISRIVLALSESDIPVLQSGQLLGRKCTLQPSFLHWAFLRVVGT